MKTSLRSVFAALVFTSFLCGCIRYHYDGKSLPPTGKPVKVFWKKIEIVRPYEVLGEAEVWGNYQDCTRGSLLEKLENKAAGAGADAILILRYSIKTGERVSGGDGTFIGGYDVDNSGSGIKQAEQSMDRTYGNARGRGSNAANVMTIRRYMTAQYLRYTDTAAGQAPAAKLPVKAAGPKKTVVAPPTAPKETLNPAAETPAFRAASEKNESKGKNTDSVTRAAELPVKTAPPAPAAAPVPRKEEKPAPIVIMQDPRQRSAAPAEKDKKANK